MQMVHPGFLSDLDCGWSPRNMPHNKNNRLVYWKPVSGSTAGGGTCMHGSLKPLARHCMRSASTCSLKQVAKFWLLTPGHGLSLSVRLMMGTDQAPG